MNTHCNKSLFNLILQKRLKLYIMFLYFKGVIKMGVFIGGIIAGIVIIFLGVILAKVKIQSFGIFFQLSEQEF